MSVLITGGAGYLGGHLALALAARQDAIVLVDRNAAIHDLKSKCSAAAYHAELAADELLPTLIDRHDVDVLVHLADSPGGPIHSSAGAARSIANVATTRSVVERCIQAGVREIVYCSSSAVYGNGDGSPIRATDRLDPISQYGRCKAETELMLKQLAQGGGARVCCIRFFNIAGADAAGRWGPSIRQSGQLLPQACRAALGSGDAVNIFGVDHPTTDGTCVRDFVHVQDAAEALVSAIDALKRGAPSATYNCGAGRGVSVREVVREVERFSGLPVPVREMPRRPGELSVAVADPADTVRDLGWVPCHSSLENIVSSAFEWEVAATSS